MLRLASVLVLCEIVCGVVAHAQPRSHWPESAWLTSASVEEALEMGRSGAPTPYFPARQLGGARGPAVAVYTPFVRVAMMSAGAWAQGRELSAGELPPWVIEPSVLAVFRAPCQEPPCDIGSVDRYHSGLLPSHVLIGPRLSTDDPNAATVAAKSITQSLGFLDAIGGRPFDHAVIAAIFPPEALRADTSLYAMWTMDEGRMHVFSGARITASDMATWR